MIQWLQNYSGTGVHGENLEKSELENLRKELKHYKKKYEKELKDIEILSEDEDPVGQDEQKNIDDEMRKKQQKKKYKRPTISDEPLPQSEFLMNNMNYNQQQQIGDVSEKFEKFKEKIQNLFFFKYLSPEELNEVLASFQTEQFNEGDTIFEQGNNADKLYFLDQGEVSCWKTMRPEDPMTFIKVYKEGDSFGELALMYNYIRNYTILAKTNVVLLSLDRKTYKNIAQGNIRRKRENFKIVLEKVEIFQTLTPEEISKIMDIIEEREFKVC
jgi:cAMP-dependent protein kinase regulator